MSTPFTTDPPPPADPTSTSYSNPSHSDLAAVVATVSLVGVLMAVLITWLALRLRQTNHDPPVPIIQRRPTYVFRPSFAPSEASSKFGFARRPLRLSRRQHDTSWDFADPDPFSPMKECTLESPTSPSRRHRPAPLSPAPAYTPRAHRTSTHKDDLDPRTPTTPATPATPLSLDAVELPPPVYCRDSGARWSTHHPKDMAPT